MITRRGLLIALLLLTGCFSFAQVSFQVILPAAPPGGVGANCLATTYGYLAPVTGGSELVLCDPTTHTWTVQAGGGGGGNCTVAGSTGDLQMNGGSSNCAASHVNDNGTTVASTEPIAAPFITTGTNPPAVTPGTGGGISPKEGTAPSVGAASGVDICYADSTSHGILCSFNNGAYSLVCLVSAGCGGGSPFADTQVATGNIAMTGSDVVVYTSSLPALAAGACFVIDWSLMNTNSGDQKVKIGSTVIFDTGGGVGAPVTYASLKLCNLTASQTSQITLISSFLYNDASTTRLADNMYAPTTTAMYGTQALNLATTSTLTITNNQASGNIQGNGLHVGVY